MNIHAMRILDFVILYLQKYISGKESRMKKQKKVKELCSGGEFILILSRFATTPFIAYSIFI